MVILKLTCGKLWKAPDSRLGTKCMMDVPSLSPFQTEV